MFKLNEEEKSSHVLQCSNESAKLNFINSVHTSIEPALDEQKTEPNLSKAIVKIICDYRRGKKINPNNYSEAHGLREAIREQNEGLKWYHFILGRWSPQWQLVQKSYLQSIGSKRSPLRWCTAIIHKFLLTVNDVWQYRNKLVHSKDGELQTDERNRLQNLIYQEFIIGRNDLLDCDMFLFEEYDLEQLIAADLDTKKFWLARMNAARKAVDLPEETEQNEEPNMR